METEFPTTEQRSRLMKKVKRSKTDLEESLAGLLREFGVHFRRNVKGLPGTPDFAHKGKQKAIFVNGCFWHAHSPDCRYSNLPARNQSAWDAKLRRNRLRDQRKIDALRAEGFDVLTVWQCDFDSPPALRGRLKTFLEERRTAAALSPSADEWQSEEDQAETAVEAYYLDPKTAKVVRRVRRRDGTAAQTYEKPTGLADDGDFGALFDQSWLRRKAAPRYSRGGEAEIRIVDLFSGCGGMSLGVMEAARALGLSARVVMAADSDAEAMSIFKENLKPTVVERRSLHDLLQADIDADPSELERQLVDRVGRVDVLIGGPPCQGHSNLNNHTRRDDPKNELYARMARFARLVNPDHILIENVPGVVYDKGGVFEITLNALRKQGYGLDYGVVKGELVGVPQTRHRVFVVASKKVRPRLAKWLDECRTSGRSFDWACRDLFTREPDGLLDVPTRMKDETLRRIEHLFENGTYNLPDEERPDCHAKKKHSYVSVYGRIHDWKPAPTITTGFTVMGQGRFVNPYLPRTLTPREGARLQFFPAWFDFGKRTRRTYAQVIGNAVPPKMIYPLALGLLR